MTDISKVKWPNYWMNTNALMYDGQTKMKQ